MRPIVFASFLLHPILPMSSPIYSLRVPEVFDALETSLPADSRTAEAECAPVALRA